MNSSEKKKIAQIESLIVADKPWQLKGEVGAQFRPVNSLLFEDVNFDQRLKAPKITPESTEVLEELIKQRIKDNKFDDPTRKIRTTSTTDSAPQVEISSEKSKVGLAQIYEDELRAKADPLSTRSGPEKDIEKKINALFRKLDALVDR